MKRYIHYILLVLLLLTLTACSNKGDILGVWEQSMETSVLGEGVEEATTVASLRRFVFCEDGSGRQEHIMLDGSYPDAIREFHYHLKEDVLTLVYADDHMEDFTVKVSKNTLKLENSRGNYELTRAE